MSDAIDDRCKQMATLIDRHLRNDGVQLTELPRVTLVRASQPTEPIHTVYQPTLCVTVQGRKQAMLGEQIFQYRRGQYIVVSVEVPITSRIVEANTEEPYLCFALGLDAAILGDLLLERRDLQQATATEIDTSLAISDATPELLDACVRLLHLLDKPEDAPVLAPITEREILYWLLKGDQGDRLRQIARGESKLQQVNRAISWLKQHFRQRMTIEELAREACMSSSALHQHFKSITNMTPLQYQKQLRLQEARRLMLSTAIDASTAGHEVGYNSPSQFSREYSRLFGAPPGADIARLREQPEMLEFI